MKGAKEEGRKKKPKRFYIIPSMRKEKENSDKEKRFESFGKSFARYKTLFY